MSVKGLREFTLALNQFQENTIKEHENLCKKIANELTDKIVFNTPIDTGLARGNWQASTGSPVTDSISDLDKVGSSTVSKCKSVFKSSHPMLEVLWLSNRLDYIEALEDGHSQKQAPNGMVELALLSIKAQGVK